MLGGGERVSRGRAHSYFADKRVSDDQYISQVGAQRPVEIRVAMKEAVQAGMVFIKTVSDGILIKDVIPPHFVLSVEDTDKKSNLYIGKEETEKIAKETGAERGVQQHVAKIEGWGSPGAQTSSLRHQSGCLMYLAMHEAACPRLRLQKLKPQKQRPKHQRHHLQDHQPKRQNHQDLQHQKQILQGLQFQKQKLIHQRQLQKLPLRSQRRTNGAGSTPKSLGKDTVPKKTAEAPPEQALPSVKLEVSQRTRCFAQTFQGQIQCDVCGLTLERTPQRPSAQT